MSELKPLPCPICGDELKIHGPEDWHPTPYDPDSGGDPYSAFCDCGFQYSNGSYDYSEFVLCLNRRAQPAITGETSDGYHTFNELYHHRAVLFGVICNTRPSISWKSRQHHDGTMYDGMFIVGINTPDGQATYHYDVEPYWKMFRVPELPHAPEWDGHTPAQAIERIGKLSAQPDNEPLTLDELRKMRGQVVDIPESEFWYSGRGTVLDDGVYDPKDQDGYWPFKYYGEWLAYDHKQGGEQDG